MLARAIGRLAHRLAVRRRAVVAANLALCFPDMGVAVRRRIERESFEWAAIGVVDTARAWLGDIRRAAAESHIAGLETLHEAQARGRGVILLGAHFTNMELAGAVLARRVPFAVMYRSYQNAAIDHLAWRGRHRHFSAVIERSDLRRVLGLLRSGGVVWYAADQDYGPRHSRFEPFLGVPAATISVAERLQRRTGAALLGAASYWRDGHIEIVIEPLAGMGAYNRWLSGLVAAAPAQYLWLHRRFKTRPPGSPAIY